MVSVRSVTIVSLDARRGCARCRRGSCRASSAARSARCWRRAGAGCRARTAGWPLYQAATRSFSTPCTTLPTSDSRTGAPLRQAMTRSAIVVRRHELVVGAEREGLPRAVEAALGAVDVGVGDGGAHVLQRQPVGGEPRRVRRTRTAGRMPPCTGDPADAVDLRQFRLQQRVGGVAERGRSAACPRSAPGSGSAHRPGSPWHRSAGRAGSPAASRARR